MKSYNKYLYAITLATILTSINGYGQDQWRVQVGYGSYALKDYHLEMVSTDLWETTATNYSIDLDRLFDIKRTFRPKIGIGLSTIKANVDRDNISFTDANTLLGSLQYGLEFDLNKITNGLALQTGMRHYRLLSSRERDSQMKVVNNIELGVSYSFAKGFHLQVTTPISISPIYRHNIAIPNDRGTIDFEQVRNRMWGLQIAVGKSF